MLPLGYGAHRGKFSLREDLGSEEAILGASMASAVRRVATAEGCGYIPIYEAHCTYSGWTKSCTTWDSQKIKKFLGSMTYNYSVMQDFLVHSMRFSLKIVC